MNDKVSIIIPAYNVESYIIECLDSIERQTYKNIEIIVIDDGSSDNTLEILNRRALNSTRSYLVLSQNNAGQSVARNRGLKEASGEFIVFVDSDDWLTGDSAIEKMVNKIQSEKADFVQCSLEFVKAEKHSVYRVPQKESISGVQPLHDMLMVQDLYTSPWAKIYSANFLIKNNLTFMEGLVNEDTAFSILIASKANKVGFLNDVVYSSREREGSTSRSSFGRMFKTMHTVLIKTQDELIKNGNFSEEVKNLFESRYLRSMLYNLMQTAQRNRYKTYAKDYEYCLTQTNYKTKLKYKNFLPSKYRTMVSLSMNKIIFYTIAKILKVIGIQMH